MQTKISLKNQKLGRVANFSLPPVASCPVSAGCKDEGCYAKKAYKQYPDAKKAWKSNFQLARNHPEVLFREVVAWVQLHQPELFRIHVSGDFFSQEYLTMWENIALACPNTKFLAWSRVVDLFTIRFIPNLTILASVWPGQPMPKRATEFPLSFVTHTKTRKETRIQGNRLLCPGHCQSCKHCWTMKPGDSVVLPFH